VQGFSKSLENPEQLWRAQGKISSKKSKTSQKAKSNNKGNGKVKAARLGDKPPARHLPPRLSALRLLAGFSTLTLIPKLQKLFRIPRLPTLTARYE